MRSFVQGHTDSKWQRRDFYPCLIDSKFKFFAVLLYYHPFPPKNRKFYFSLIEVLGWCKSNGGVCNYF